MYTVVFKQKVVVRSHDMNTNIFEKYFSFPSHIFFTTMTLQGLHNLQTTFSNRTKQIIIKKD